MRGGERGACSKTIDKNLEKTIDKKLQLQLLGFECVRDKSQSKQPAKIDLAVCFIENWIHFRRAFLIRSA